MCKRVQICLERTEKNRSYVEFSSEKNIIRFYFPQRKIKSKKEQVTNPQVEPTFAGVERGSWPKSPVTQLGLDSRPPICTYSASHVALLHQFFSLDQNHFIWLLISRALFACCITCSELCVSYRWENMCVVPLHQEGKLLVQSCFPQSTFSRHTTFPFS